MKHVDLQTRQNFECWHKVTLSPIQTKELSNEIRVWAIENGSDKSYVRAWNEYRFEDEKDAVLFALRWS